MIDPKLVFIVTTINSISMPVKFDFPLKFQSYSPRNLYKNIQVPIKKVRTRYNLQKRQVYGK
jgi:hypothetical protein